MTERTPRKAGPPTDSTARATMARAFSSAFTAAFGAPACGFASPPSFCARAAAGVKSISAATSGCAKR